MSNLIYEIKQFIKSKTFIFSISLSLILSIFFIFMCVSDKHNMYKNIFYNITNIYFTFSMLIVCLINSSKLYSYIKSNTLYLGRFNSRIEVNKHFLKVITILNTIILLVSYIIPILMTIVFKDINIENTMYYTNVSYLSYLIYYVIRSIILTNVIVLIYFGIRFILNDKVALIYYLYV